MEAGEYGDDEICRGSDHADNLNNVFVVRGIHLGVVGEDE